MQYLILQIKHSSINPAALNEFRMRAAFDDATGAQDDDLIDVVQADESMCNHDACAFPRGNGNRA
jgi:hypothetical protein